MKVPLIRRISVPARTEIKVIPADKPGKPTGWVVSEHIGVGVFNPQGVTRLAPPNLFSHIFTLNNFDIYYDETDSRYYLVEKEESFNLGSDGERLPVLIKSAEKAQRLASYVFEPDGKIIKDRDGAGSNVFTQIKKAVDVHQVMVS